jgi:restriction endonuclease S subunit
MHLLLKDAAIITVGHPIRDAVRNTPGGDVAVVQIKNVDVETGIDWPSVAVTKLTGKRQPDWLKSGDVLFSARGQRNVAVCVDQPPLKAVCSPHFFLIRVSDALVPEFLAWQMNLPGAQKYFAQSATGSYITSIRRQVLEALVLRVPAVERQRLIAGLAETARRERHLMRKLIENRQRELELVAKNLLDLG